jgi:hypothetical protein
MDRSNTYRCLAILLKKGYVGKFYGDKGPAYFAIQRRLKTSMKSAAFKVILDYLDELDASGRPQELFSLGEVMTTMTTRTTPTTLTTPPAMPRPESKLTVRTSDSLVVS